MCRNDDRLYGGIKRANQGAVRGTVWTVVSLVGPKTDVPLRVLPLVTHEVSPVKQQAAQEEEE